MTAASVPVVSEAPHGTSARWHSGCRCTQCRAAHSDTKRAWRRARARKRLPLEVRQQLVEAIYAGQPFRTVLRDLGLTPNQVWGLTKTDQEWSAELEAALTATRRDDIEHGATAAYVAGCVCAECREHQRTPPNAATWMSPSPNSARSPTAATTSWPKPGLNAGPWYACPSTQCGH